MNERNALAQMMYDARFARLDGPTQEKIARELEQHLPGGRNARSYANWERGAFLPRRSALPALAKVLNLDLTDVREAWARADEERLNTKNGRGGGA